MKLVISRAQAKSIIGGSAFEVRARLDLTNEEARLVDHYKLGDEVIAFSNKKDLIMGGMKSVKVKNLVNGDVYKAKNLLEVLAYTDSMTEVCRDLKVWIDVAKKFGGDEVIEIA